LVIGDFFVLRLFHHDSLLLGLKLKLDFLHPHKCLISNSIGSKRHVRWQLEPADPKNDLNWRFGLADLACSYFN